MLNLRLSLRPTSHASKHLPSCASPRYVSTLSHFKAHSPTSVAFSPRSKEVARAVAFVRQVRQQVREGRSTTAYKRVHGALNASTFSDNLRSRILEMTARVFLSRRQFKSAAEIYNRMLLEGFVPSFSLRTRMLVLDVLSQSPTRDALSECIEFSISQPQFDERCFRTLLHFLRDTLHCSHTLIDAVVANYVRLREPNYPLSETTNRLLARLRMISSMQEHSSLSDLPSSILRTPEEPPDSAKLLYLANSKFNNPRQFYQALEPWINVGAGVRCCNALIAMQLKSKRYDKAFRIYELMCEDKEHSLVPNTTTFDMLFQAYNLLDKTQNRRSRRAKPPPSTLSSRELFGHMLECMRAKSSSKDSASVSTMAILNRALQTFMYQSDYAAAFVTIRTFSIFGLQPTLETYRSVLHPLMLRIQNEVQQKDKDSTDEFSWSYRFLSYPELPTEVNVSNLERVMSFGERPHVRQARVQHPPPAPVSPQDIDPIRTPLLYKVIHSKDPSSVRINPAPLRRILSRALLATHDTLYDAPGKTVSDIIVQTKAVMIPKGLPPAKQLHPRS
ncbi:hypothetical protein QCA50_001125 [Cerrena zonata]|uniref:Pentatricopeptide repeat-containing protein n=1 Tax=Cerrena zonata TaxID=2478898 RepID=A0AAW0GZ30_9APHY